ncbi:hypothetical protein ACAW74_09775 [Fibrella sp. WM1]|uniref:DUF6934 family protein n=1 Tax=Fibrella musci TaxID=3242485 RepID=UPI003523082C
MNNNKYDLRVNSTGDVFAFNSISARRTIFKVIEFSPINLEDLEGTGFENVYNLGFGDYDPDTGEVNDSVSSNNEDRDKVLATVAAAALHFLYNNPSFTLYAIGSTPARTRLYQMGLNSHYDSIIEEYNLYGLSNQHGWQPFERNTNYLAFVMRKR